MEPTDPTRESQQSEDRDHQNTPLRKPEKPWRLDRKLSVPDIAIAVLTLFTVPLVIVQSCALNETNRLTVETTQIEQRAWLVLSPSGEPITDTTLAMVLALRNTGGTPARRVRYRRDVKVQPFYEGPAARQRLSQAGWVSNGDVFPDESGRAIGHLEALTPSTAGEYAATYQGIRRRVYGTFEVRYCDAFDIPHWIVTCHHKGGGETAWSSCGTVSDRNRTPSDECRGEDPLPPWDSPIPIPMRLSD